MNKRQLILTKENYDKYILEIYGNYHEKFENGNLGRLEKSLDGYYNLKFVYKKELAQILDIMEKNDQYRILIIGVPGSGKTTLLHQLCNKMKDEWSWKYVYGYNVEQNLASLHNKKDILLIDALDAMKNQELFLDYLRSQSCSRMYVLLVQEKSIQLSRK